jgi:outer membrane biosynthesis protein TonB
MTRKEIKMDLKITFDVTPALADAAKCLCRALELRSTHAHAFHCAAAHVEPQKADAPAEAPNSPVEAPEPVDMPKPAPTLKNAAEAKPEATASVSAPEPAPEPAPETVPKKRSRKKVDVAVSEEPAPANAPAPIQPEPASAPVQPEPAPAPVQPEPAPVQPEAAPAETTNAPTIDDVRAVGVKLGAAGKQSVIIDYLKAHGCKSLSQLDPGCYAELIEIGRAAL